MDKETWLSAIAFPSNRVLISDSCKSEEYVINGKYQDYFLSTLRADGDER